MKINNNTMRISLATTLAIIVVTVFISLGLWQLERARGKAHRIALQHARMQQPPVTLGATSLDGATLEFAAVTLHGVFEKESQVFIDNIIRDGLPGYEVLTPFRPQRSKVRVWVNRGWLPWQQQHAQLPAVPVPQGLWHLNGHAYVPSGGRLQLGDGCCTAPPPGPWLDVDMAALATIASWPIQPFIVRLHIGRPHDGLARDKVTLPSDYWIHRHRAYAVQWFALAVTTLIIGGVLFIRRHKRCQARGGS